MLLLRSVKGYTERDKTRNETTRKVQKISGIQDIRSAYKLIGSTTSEEWTTPDFRNMPSVTSLEEEEIVDDQR
jgi:hypothetical protein